MAFRRVVAFQAYIYTLTNYKLTHIHRFLHTLQNLSNGISRHRKHIHTCTHALNIQRISHTYINLSNSICRRAVGFSTLFRATQHRPFGTAQRPSPDTISHIGHRRGRIRAASRAYSSYSRRGFPFDTDYAQKKPKTGKETMSTIMRQLLFTRVGSFFLHT